MLIATKDIRKTIQNLPVSEVRSEDFRSGFQLACTYMFDRLAEFEKYKFAHTPELPYAESLTEEKALIVYCTPKLFEFVEKFEDVDDINLIMVGKLWLEVKKFLKEGKFKRV